MVLFLFLTIVRYLEEIEKKKELQMKENKGHIRPASVIEGIWAEEVKRGELCDLLYAADQCQSMCGSVCLSIMSEEF